ncbi:apoptosis inhibitor cassowary [Leptinotarsa decemlineata]|uniref:apoptosis inhibitor cassowary n=1 Tax=Leptinotarsa decemlineata TaxID=7539 RepID=UPI000C2556EF|nr:apoptosis inhibitor 5 [Leptinotarsa decemlineata]
MADSLAEMYEKYNILSDAKENISKHSKEYLQCIERAKGSDKEKQLAAQIISKFFKHFPSLQDQAIEAIYILCEDDDSLIQICTIKILHVICKDAKEHIPKIVNILAQLLQAEDKVSNAASSSLLQVFKEDPHTTVKVMLDFINNPCISSSTEDIPATEKSVEFLYKKLVKLDEKLTPEINDLLLEEGKKIILDSNATEFLTVLPFLASSKLTKTIAGQQELVNLIAERAEIDKDFDPLDEGSQNADKIMMCVEHALPFFSANVESTRFVKFYCDQILGHWKEMGTLKDGSIMQYQFLKQLAELSTHCGKLETPSFYVVQIFDKLKLYMPLPPEDCDIDKMPNLDFTSVECLLYSFHRIARQCPDFLTSDPMVLKDFRSRLNYFSRGVGGCKKSLEKIQIKNKDDEKIKIAPAVLDNITTLIKDLFYTTPVYKCNIHLSFKSLEKKIKLSPENPQAPQKRHAPIHFESSNGSTNKQIRSNKGAENKLYTPPSGKFSSNFQSFDRVNRGRGRGGRGTRGSRGSSRSWRN